MRRLFPVFAALFSLSLLAFPASAAPLNLNRHFHLVTQYPAITMKGGETTNLDLKLHNSDARPEVLKLAVQNVPSGWKAQFIGDDRPISEAMPDTDNSVDFSLRLTVPEGATPSTRTISVKATGRGVDESLPIRVSIGKVLPPKIELTTKLPSLRDSVTSTFEYDFKLKNDSSQKLMVKLAAAAPPDFDTAFTEEYGSKQLTAVPVEAGKSKDLKLKVTPPPGAAARDYKVKVHASTQNAAADLSLGLEATGKPEIKLASANERLNADAVAGQPSQINLVVRNNGSAPAKDVEVSADPPSKWKVSFAPKKIELLPPGAKRSVVATVTPSDKTIAGDYMTTIRASATGTGSSSDDFRITVTTSTMWGVFGLAIIAIALLVLGGAVIRFGRR